MEHDHPPGWRPREIVTFFNSIFNGGIPLAKITNIEKQDSVITFNYESSLSLKSAQFSNFITTNDTFVTTDANSGLMAAGV